MPADYDKPRLPRPITPDEQAQIDAFVAAGHVRHLPTIRAEDASVEHFLRARRNNPRAPRFKGSRRGPKQAKA